MSNVVSIFKNKDSFYEKRIMNMHKIELLEEMVKFQDEKARTGTLTRLQINNGIILFRELEKQAETPEMKQLASAYQKHLRLTLSTFK